MYNKHLFLFQEVLEAIMFVSKVLYCIFMYIVILNIISVNIGVHFVKWTVINCNTAVYDIVVQLKRRIFNYFVHCAIVYVLCMGVMSVVSSVCVYMCKKKAVLFLLFWCCESLTSLNSPPAVSFGSSVNMTRSFVCSRHKDCWLVHWTEISFYAFNVNVGFNLMWTVSLS